MLQPTLIDKPSVISGAVCALCKQPFNPQDEVIVCPVDETRHHTYCWEANGNRCTALGCAGQGPIAGRGGFFAPASHRANARSRPASRPAGARSFWNAARGVQPQVTAAPAPPPAIPAPVSATVTPAAAARSTTPPAPWHQRWAQSCLILAIALAIVLFGFSCFGLWAIADYILLHVLEWGYRSTPQNDLLPSLVHQLALALPLIWAGLV